MTREAAGEAAALPVVIRARIHEIIGRLEQWPNISGTKPLRGSLAGYWRVRTGDYRIRFFFLKREIVVDKVGHRSHFYGE